VAAQYRVWADFCKPDAVLMPTDSAKPEIGSFNVQLKFHQLPEMSFRVVVGISK